MNITQKNPEANLKLKFVKYREIGLVLALGILVVLLQAFKRSETKVVEQGRVDLKIEVQEIIIVD